MKPKSVVLIFGIFVALFFDGFQRSEIKKGTSQSTHRAGHIVETRAFNGSGIRL